LRIISFMPLNRKFKLWLPVLVWAGIIFTFSSLSINQPAPFNWLDFIVKKTAHVTEYAIFYFLVWRGWSNAGRFTDKSILWKSLLVTLIYALSDEWHQTIIPGREGTLRDIGFDTIGMLLALNQIKKNL